MTHPHFSGTTERPSDPVRVPVNPAGIPAELRALDQWVGWRIEWRADAKGERKPTKVPINLRTGRRAASDDPTTWATFAEALQAIPDHDGIGFVFSEADEFFGVDLDGSRDPDTGDLAPWARQIVAAFNTYTEVSPSGTGVKLFGRGRLPEGAWHKKPVPGGAPLGGKTPAIETYDRLRFFAVTGAALEDLS